MIDTINPMNFDITKNLHGHVRVETRDRWTGRVVDSQEKDNLVTNALQRALMAQMWCNGGNMPLYWTPIYAKVLGGLFLFNGSLTASADNTSFPSSVKLVGYAGQYSNSDANTGSYNSVESVLTSSGFATVWDFETSQANGTIASLARTNYEFYGNPAAQNTSNILTYVVNSPDASLFPVGGIRWLGYDETNKYIYIAFSGNLTIRGVSLSNNTIYRFKKDLGVIDLINCFPPVERLTPVKTLSSSDGTTTAYNFVYDSYANCFLYLDGATLHVIAADGTHSTKTLTGVPTSGTGGKFAVTENYYWYCRNGVLAQASKSTSAVQTISLTSAGQYIAPLKNDVIWTMGNNQSLLVYPDLSTFSILYGNTGYNNMEFRPLGDYLYAKGDDTFWRPSTHYLGTIANLDSPVTKTSSQTMKITYTLTEA